MPHNKSREIFEVLKSDILAGRYGRGMPLPSSSALMRKFGIARATAVSVLKRLENDGLVVSRRGSGTYPVSQGPTMFGVIVPNAENPFLSRMCSGIANCASSVGGKYSLLWATGALKTSAQILSFAGMCVDSKVAGVFFRRTKDAKLTREVMALFKAAKIPVVLLGGGLPPAGFAYDIVGINYIVRAGRKPVDIASAAVCRDVNLLNHGELFGDVALRLMLQRLQYGTKHPPAEVFLDLPKPSVQKKKTNLK